MLAFPGWFAPMRTVRASGGTADALASGASVRKDVGVQIPPRAPVATPGRPGVVRKLRQVLGRSRPGVSVAMGVLTVHAFIGCSSQGGGGPSFFTVIVNRPARGTRQTGWLRRRRMTVSIPIALLAVTACTTTEPTAEPSSFRSPPSQPAPEEPHVSTVRITVADQTITAQLADNPTADDLIDQLPLTLTFRDFNRVEKVAELPRPLTMDGVPAGDDPDINDIGYYAPSRSLVFYYGDVGYWNGIVLIGRFADRDITLDRAATRRLPSHHRTQLIPRDEPARGHRRDSAVRGPDFSSGYPGRPGRWSVHLR